jgi:hypothetical protein
MQELSELVDDVSAQREERMANGRKTKQVQGQAAGEVRDAAMTGMTKRSTLTNLASLPNATVREKQGQRIEK